MGLVDKPSSAFAPLRHPVFRSLWIASLVSNVGTLIQSVGQGWLMTSLSPSPLLVALIQTAESLPIFLFALPGGALADLVPRRRLLLVTQGWMLCVAATLAGLTFLGLTTAPVILLSSFCLSLGAALNAPAWQSSMPDLVPRNEIPLAISLNGIGYNLARVLGPAIGGVVVAAAGPAATFLLNSISFVGVIAALLLWKDQQPVRMLPAERVMGAVRTGLRYARHSRPLQTVYLRVAGFIFFASALWGLLPIYARREIEAGSLGYGLLLGSLGSGAVLAAMLQPRLRARVERERLLLGAGGVFALALLVLSHVRWLPGVCLAMCAAGIAWLTMMTTFNTTTQTTVPTWVRARAVSMYLLVFHAGMAFGSFTWGSIATQVGVSRTLLIAGLGLIVSLAITRRQSLPTSEDLDLTPWENRAQPMTNPALEPEDGPVLVLIEYLIDPIQADAFRNALADLGAMRKRTGAFEWGLFADTTDARKFTETFFVETWAEHLRQHDRITVEDRKYIDRARAFEVGDAGPKISHLVYAYERRKILGAIRVPWRIDH